MKFTKAAIKLVHPESGAVYWFSDYLDAAGHFPLFSSCPVAFPIRYAMIVSDQLRRSYPMVLVVMLHD